LNKKDETAERFPANPFLPPLTEAEAAAEAAAAASGSVVTGMKDRRLYRTGDLAIMLDGGFLQVCARLEGGSCTNNGKRAPVAIARRPTRMGVFFLSSLFEYHLISQVYLIVPLSDALPVGTLPPILLCAYQVLGRCKFMYKVRGYSVVPGKVEACLCAALRIKAAAVICDGDEGGEKRLVAFIVKEPWGQAHDPR
jgi:acyl-CoA synthetase (AMP-forming)/AMP-acid ligase II